MKIFILVTILLSNYFFLYSQPTIQWQQCYGGSGIAGVVSTMSVYNNQLFVGGAFSLVNGEEMFNLVKWTGSEWENCDSGITGDEEGMVSSLEVFDNKLFIFWIFDSANGINCNNAIVYTE